MKRLIYIVSVGVLLLSRVVLAGDFFDSILDEVNNSFTVIMTSMHLNYREDVREFYPILPKDVEDYGNTYGVKIDYRTLFYETIYAEFGGDYAIGKIQYDGFNLETLKPRKRKISQQFANVDLKLGIQFIDGEYFQLIPYSGIGFHYWKNNEISKYYHYKAIVGSKVNIAFFDKLVLSPYFNVGKTLGARAKSGDLKFKLGRKTIQEFGLEINYRWNDEIFLTGMVSHTHFGYGKAETQDRIEPNSKTNELRFGVGIKISLI